MFYMTMNQRDISSLPDSVRSANRAVLYGLSSSGEVLLRRPLGKFQPYKLEINSHDNIGWLSGFWGKGPWATNGGCEGYYRINMTNGTIDSTITKQHDELTGQSRDPKQSTVHDN